MRAVIFDHHDPSPQAYHLVDTLPPPEVAADGVVIRVAYAALNRLDNFVRIGWQGLDLAWPHVPCSDFSGEIVAIGREVTGWRLGQRVTANPLVWCGRCRACLAGRHNLCRAAHLIGEHVRGACAARAVTSPDRPRCGRCGAQRTVRPEGRHGKPARAPGRPWRRGPSGPACRRRRHAPAAALRPAATARARCAPPPDHLRSRARAPARA